MNHSATESRDILFFSPGGVSSSYSGRGASFCAVTCAFFSLLFDRPVEAGVFAVLACFSANFLFFSAFLRSFSTTDP